MSSVDRYFDDISQRLRALGDTQGEPIEQAAVLAADAIEARHPIYIYDSGHLIGHEFIARTGGLAAYTPLSFRAEVTHDNEWISTSRAPSAEERLAWAKATVEWLFTQGTLRTGDLLIVSSVSGTSPQVVELAAKARGRELKVIAVTGADFSAALPADHPSGQRLRDVADVVLDNCVPHGDAALPIPGLTVPVAPWSGISGVALLWAMTARTVEILVDRGVTPTVFTSYNLPGGEEAYQAARARYREIGQ